MSYIGAIAELIQQAETIASPMRRHEKAALRVLSINPVPDEPPFLESEVRLIGKYRISFSVGWNDPVWRAIHSGEPEAWLYAVHEAAELQAFYDLAVDPFVLEQRNQHLAEAHLRATIFEIQYQQRWASHLGHATSEMALEAENPLRAWIRHHDQLVEAIQARTGWHSATDEERIAAQAFWNTVLRGNP